MTDLELWIRYWLIWPGLAQRGALGAADAILGLSLGRNTLSDAFRFRVRECLLKHNGDEWHTADELRRQINPGEPNSRIARQVEQFANHLPHLPVIVQWEVALALNPWWWANNIRRVVVLWPSASPNDRFSVYDVLSLARKSRSYHHPLIIAHQRLIVRAVLIAKRLGFDPIVVPNKITLFDPRSVQPWTASARRWIPREIAARLHHVRHGWV